MKLNHRLLSSVAAVIFVIILSAGPAFAQGSNAAVRTGPTPDTATGQSPLAATAPAASDSTPLAPTPATETAAPLAPTAATEATAGSPFADDDLGGEGFMLGELVVTARRENESLDDPPVFVEVLNMKDEQGRFVTSEEVVSRSAGVSVRDFGGLGSISEISIRGSSSDQVVVLLDGIRLNPASGGGVDFSTIPVGHIKSIEVIRGGDSAFYGDGALGGVINIVTRDPRAEPESTFGLGYGSFNTTRISATRSGGGDLSYLLSGVYLHSDGDFPFTNNNGTEQNENDDFLDRRENNDVNSAGLLARADYESGDYLLGLHNEFYYVDRGVPGMVTFPTPEARQTDWRDSAAAELTTSDFLIRNLQAKSLFGFLYNYSKYKDETGGGSGIAFTSERDQYSPSIEQSLRYSMPPYQVVTLSGSYRIDQLIDDQFDDPLRYNFALAARDKLFFFDDAVILVPALRYDRISSIGQQTSPKLGAAWWLTDWFVLKGNAGRSFRAPNFDELYFNRGFVEGNPDLKPERATSYDAGFQIQSPMFFCEAAYYRSNVENLIEYVLISGFRYKPFNVGKARLEGVEASVRFSPWSFVGLSGSYTYTEAIDESDDAIKKGNQIPGRPRHKAFARLETPAGNLTPWVEYHYVGGNYITEANTKLLDARQIINAGLIGIVGKDVRMGFEVKNIADHQEVDVRGFPLPGRSFFLTLEASLPH